MKLIKVRVSDEDQYYVVKNSTDNRSGKNRKWKSYLGFKFGRTFGAKSNAQPFSSADAKKQIELSKNTFPEDGITVEYALEKK